jgi:hypothetical protein
LTKSRGIGRGGKREGAGRPRKIAMPWGNHRTAFATRPQDPDVARVASALEQMLAMGGDLEFMARLILGGHQAAARAAIGP